MFSCAIVSISRFFDGGSLKIVLLHCWRKTLLAFRLRGLLFPICFLHMLQQKSSQLGLCQPGQDLVTCVFLDQKSNHSSRDRAVEPEGSLRSWLLQANEQNYLLIELNLREEPTAEKSDWWIDEWKIPMGNSHLVAPILMNSQICSLSSRKSCYLAIETQRN